MWYRNGESVYSSNGTVKIKLSWGVANQINMLDNKHIKLYTFYSLFSMQRHAPELLSSILSILNYKHIKHIQLYHKQRYCQVKVWQYHKQRYCPVKIELQGMSLFMILSKFCCITIAILLSNGREYKLACHGKHYFPDTIKKVLLHVKGTKSQAKVI